MFLLKKEIDLLKGQLLSLTAVVEESVGKAVLAVGRRDVKMTEEVLETDHKIDELEVQLEEECLKILALHQPVANDLRFIIAVLKINNDLERIGDLAVNIAKRVKYLVDNPHAEMPFMSEMAEKVRTMLRTSLDCLVNLDAQKARDLLLMDDEVDKLNRRHFEAAQEQMQKHPDHILGILGALTVSRNLERIADLATNIGEDVIYMVDGQIVRHMHDV